MSTCHSRAMHRVSKSSSLFFPSQEPVSKVRKWCGVETSHAPNLPCGQRRIGNPNRKTHWRASAVEDARQSSHDKRKSSRLHRKWKDISLEVEALGTAFEEKKHTWNKSCKEIAKKEIQQNKMTECAANDEKTEDNERNVIKKNTLTTSKRRR